MFSWYNYPLDSRAHAGGELAVNGKVYKGGEFLPFYIPRPYMPQVEERDYPALMTFAALNEVGLVEHTLPVKELHAHQRINWNKAITMPPSVLAKPVLVSGDDYILDGNHRWWGHVIANLEKIKTYKFDLKFEDAISFLFAFPGTKTVKGDQ